MKKAIYKLTASLLAAVLLLAGCGGRPHKNPCKRQTLTE